MTRVRSRWVIPPETPVFRCIIGAHLCNTRVGMRIIGHIILFVSLRDCSQHQIVVSDTLRLLYDSYQDQGRPMIVNFYVD
jgi:hypothetical protein